MPNIPGVDYAWQHPGGAALAAAGKRFACRYLSGDSSKNLTKSEADDLAAHGLSSVVVWETDAARALAGRAAGIADGGRAAIQAKAAGKPDDRPIFFAVDFDATAGQQAAINAYLDGAASVLGAARVGIYGGYYPVKRALDGKHAKWAWQTIAWSGGLWDPRAVIRQGVQKTIGGVQCDLNTALAEDYGQWTPGKTPNVEDDMPLTAADIERLLDTEFDDPTDPGKKKVTVRGALWAGYGQAAAANAAAQKSAAQVGGLVGVITQLATAVKTGSALTPAQVQAAAEAGAKAALDQLGDALQG